MFETKENKTYENMMKAYAENGATVVEKISAQVSNGGQGGFDEGDTIEFPDVVKFLQLPITGSDRRADAILVKVTSKEGTPRYQPFYPSTLGKSIRKIGVDAEGKVVDAVGQFVRTKGTAATAYQSQANQNVGTVITNMLKEHPKGFKVSGSEQVTTFKYRSTEVTKANLYTIDFND